MSDLLNCPFCGSNNVLIDDLLENNTNTVFCGDCLSKSPNCLEYNDAVEAWNQRQDGWISVDTEEPPLEKVVLVKYESGIVTSGWRRQFRSDDILYCLGKKEGNWDMEINNDLGGIVIEWMPIP